mgnify:CR=1 FL=1
MELDSISNDDNTVASLSTLDSAASSVSSLSSLPSSPSASAQDPPASTFSLVLSGAEEEEEHSQLSDSESEFSPRRIFDEIFERGSKHPK